MLQNEIRTISKMAILDYWRFQMGRFLERLKSDSNI